MKKLLFAFLFTMLLTGCASYNMPPQHLYNILEKGNPRIGVTQLHCVDKKGNNVVLIPTDQTSIKITRHDNTKQLFYFITASMADSVIVGSKSTFYHMPIEPIRYSDIKKVEFDGR